MTCHLKEATKQIYTKKVRKKFHTDALSLPPINLTEIKTKIKVIKALSLIEGLGYFFFNLPKDQNPLQDMCSLTNHIIKT